MWRYYIRFAIWDIVCVRPSRSFVLSGNPLKVALQIVLLFTLLLIASGAVLVISVSNTLKAELHAQVVEESQLLRGIYRQNGLAGLKQALHQVSSSERIADAFDSNGLSLTGRIKFLPNIEINQQVIKISDGQFTDNTYLVRRFQLDDTTLIIGRSDNIITTAKQRLIIGFMVVGLVFMVAALLIGYGFSHRSARKLKQFEQTLSQVAGGDLTARLPVAAGAEQIDRVAEQVNAQLQRLQNLVCSVQNTNKAIAHDLKTPLSRAQITLLSALDACDNGEDPSASIQQALDENSHLNELFETLLRISRLQTQPADTTTFTTFDLSPMLTDIVGFLTPSAELNQQNLCITCADHLQVTADKTMLQQAVVNLVNNAIVHSGKNTTISVKAEMTDHALKLTVCDTGRGIAKTHFDQVLEPFFRLDSSRSTTGNGLGLALVQAIVEYHQGAIQLQANTPQGLCVCLTFSLISVSP
ncbi:MAG: hypothetical protein CSA79_05290 [Thiothrix nivea]|nr:MAG: hypothetical protein CSA79_05290 [Thiothrix nivea]